MINGKTVLAIIPARGGSKGIPRKNIKFLAGKPLIAWTIEEAKKSKYIDRLILSSEDNEIIKVAKDWACEVPFIRPKEFATDSSPSIDFALHAINNIDQDYDYLCLLQPTSPLRNVGHIDGCIEFCINNNASSCVAVSEVNKHPYYMYSIKESKLISFINEYNSIRRQDLNKLYAVNGSIYINRVKDIITSKSFIEKDTLGYIMPKEYSIDIDEEMDFDYAEIILANRRVKNE